MTTTEKLQRIKEICTANLETAAKRTPGKWEYWPTHWAGGGQSTQYDGKNNCPWISSDESPAFEVARINPSDIYRSPYPMGNAAFIATCAGAAEAGWKATIVAIDGLQSLSRRVPIMGSIGDYREGQLDGIGAMAEQARIQLDAIISAWEDQLS